MSATSATRFTVAAVMRPRRLMAIVTMCLMLAGVMPMPAAASGWLATSIPPTAAAEGSQAFTVIAIAEAHLRDRWQYSAIGPHRFDCSGLVFFAFREAGLLDKIGGKRRGATAFLNWFTAQGWRTGPDITKAEAGDILIWGHGAHAGIYIGDGWAISTLVNPYGVRIHRYDRINKRLTDVLHVQISREAPEH